MDLDTLKQEDLQELHLKLLASSGTELVAYHGYGSEKVTPDGKKYARGKWDAQVDLTPLLTDEKTNFFFPFTTTLIELRLNREPMPMGGRNDVFWFSPPAK